MRGEIEVLEVIQGIIDVIAWFVKVLYCAICSILQLLLLIIVYAQISILKVSNLLVRPH
jgi:hypothetical protein